MAQTETKKAASTKTTKVAAKPEVATAKQVVAKPAAKSEAKKTAAKEGTTKQRGAGDLAGKKIFLNLENDKVKSAEGNNPKRGKCRAWFDWYIKGGALKGGCPIEEYFKLGGKSGYVRWDLAHELIVVK